MMLENERLVKKFANATKDSKVVFMTCSGSGGMEAAIINCLTPQDKALVINGGSFGERFVELLTLHKIPFTEIKLKYGRALKPEHLAEYESKGYTTFRCRMFICPRKRYLCCIKYCISICKFLKDVFGGQTGDKISHTKRKKNNKTTS